MANDTSSRIPDVEKVSIVDKVVKIPSCPIPSNFPLTKEQKIDLFEKLVEAGAIKQKGAVDNWVPSNHKGEIKNASFDERKEYWKDTPETQRMDKWRNDTNALLNEYKNNPTKKAAQTFLKKILKRDDQKTLDEVEVTADTVYSTFIEGQGRGDVEYYARRIIEKTDCNIDEIEQNINLIKRLGGIYGKNYGVVAMLIIQDIVKALILCKKT